MQSYCLCPAKSLLASFIANWSITALCKLEPVFFVFTPPTLGGGTAAVDETDERRCGGTIIGVARGGGGH